MRLLHVRACWQPRPRCCRARCLSRDAIRDGLSGNYCRCTGYQAIVDAIEAVMIRRAEARVMTKAEGLDRRADRASGGAAAGGGQRPLYRRHCCSTPGHVAFLRSPYAHATDRSDRHRRGSIVARRHRGGHRRRPRRGLQAVADQTCAIAGHVSPPQFPLARDEVDLAGRARRRGRGEQSRRGRRRDRTHCDRMARTARHRLAGGFGVSAGGQGQ